MPEIDNLVHETSTGTGTGNLDLVNVDGKQPFNTAFGNGATTNVFYYFISNRDAAEYEWGTGHMSDSDTLVRDTVVGGSNGTSAVNFSAGTKDVTSAYQAAGYRELLTAARTYYVRTDGSNSNTGLVDSAAGAFLTIQKAVDVIAGTLDAGGQTITVQVKDGTFTGAVTLKNVVGAGAAGSLVIQGNNGTPANVVISTTSASCFTADGIGSVWDIKDLKMQTTTSGSCIDAASGSVVRFSNVNFGASAEHHLSSASNANLVASGNCAISGAAAAYHAHALGGLITLTFRTFTVTGTLAFGRWANAQFNGLIQASVVTIDISGATVTGTRYSVTQNSVVDTNGGGANFFPGDVAGSTATGGVYA